MRERVLLVAVGDHLERSQMVLVELVNANPDRKMDISDEQKWAEDLLVANRLYRQTAARTGDENVAVVLEDLERVLVEIAHSPSTLSREELAEIRKRIESQGNLIQGSLAGLADARRPKSGKSGKVLGHHMRNSMLFSMIFTAGLGACLAQTPPPAPAPRPAPVPPAAPRAFDLDFGLDGRFADKMERAREMMERARDKMELYRADHEHALEKAHQAMEALKWNAPFGLLAQRAPDRKGGENDERAYRRGTSYLDKREWVRAMESFDEVIESKGNRADGALYWKAYALNKLGRSPDALNVLGELQKSHPGSSWLNDAKALEAEIKQARGQAASPETETDEDLKIFAINSLINTDPERAVPLLDKLLKSNNPPKIKERALFVLAQSRSPKATETIAGYARGGTNPDLQMKAVEYIGIHGGKENRQVLSDVYAATSDFGIKRAILHAYMVGGEREKLLAAAKSEQNPELRREAIHRLGVNGAQEELWQLYNAETSPELKEALIEAMFIGGNAAKLIEVAKMEKDVKLRRNAIHRLGRMKRSQTSDALASLYGGETDPAIKKEVIHALFVQQGAKHLVDVARKESDPTLKREIVRHLSMMKSPEATDFLVELLNK